MTEQFFSVAFGEPLSRFEEIKELAEWLGEPVVQPQVPCHVADVRSAGCRCQEDVALIGDGFFSRAELVLADLIIDRRERKCRNFDICDPPG